MNRRQWLSFLCLVPGALAAALMVAASPALATTYNSPLVDGTVSVSAEDWDADEMLLADPPGDARYPEADISNVYVTWDGDYLYVGVKTSRGPGGFGNGYIVFIDTDAQAASITGATDFSRANFYARRVSFARFGAEVMVAGWSLGKPYEVRDCSDPTKTKAIAGSSAEPNAALLSYEARIPWSGIYPGGGTTVPAGSKLRVVAVSVGGDNSGAYDAAPSSGRDANANGIPDESDPATPWDGYVVLDRFLEIPLDADLNGVPDQGYPYSGGISGSVALSDPLDTQTVVTIDAYIGSSLYASAQTPRGGGAYALGRLPDAAYTLEAYATSYRKVRREVAVAAGGVVSGVDFDLRKVTGAVVGTVTVDGPAADVTLYVVDPSTGEIGGDGAKVVVGGSGTYKILTVEDGTYDLVAEARGYVRRSAPVTVAGGDTATADVAMVRAAATRYVFVDEQGEVTYSSKISRSIPASGIYDYAELTMEPRDDAGNAAVFDAGALDSVALSATLLDSSVPARGAVAFTDSLGAPIPDGLLLKDDFEDGRARFRVSDDSVEVILVAAARGGLRGAVEVGVGELRPASVGLSVAQTVIVVGQRTDLDVQLLDASGNATPTPDVAVRLKPIEGLPVFEPEVAVTDANGFARVSLLSTTAGDARFTSEVEPGEFAGLPSDTVSVAFEADEAYEVFAVVVPRAVKSGGESRVAFQVVDRYANAVALGGIRIDLSATPGDLLETLETPVYTDAGGAATSDLKAGPAYGLVAIEAASAYPVNPTKLSIDPRLAASDEAAPESDPAHNSDPNVDLTAVYAWLEPETLRVALDFSSAWEGVHLMVALETAEDAAGGDKDPFDFPIYYRHTNRPDFVFTYKYAANDYADLRRWGGSRWEYWQLADGAWTTDDGDPGKNAVGMARKTDTQVIFSFPLAAVGNLAAGSTIRLEAYVTQEAGAKYRALDSAPPDDTHDMLPAQGNWYDTAGNPQNLTQYATYIFPAAGAAPELASPEISPSSASPGERLTLTVGVTDQGGGIGDVLVDLSAVGGDAAARLNDDGAGGDADAGDGVYTVRHVVPEAVTQGLQAVYFTARDSLNVAEASVSASVTIVNPPEVIISVADSVGDDHGPNRTSGGVPVEGLYYFYPTNGVFAPGSFDIEKVDFSIDGSFLVIRVDLGDVASSEAIGWNAPYPGETCTNPDKADLNLQKIDVYIDSKEGAGATSGLPFRYADVSRSDAWEFAAVSEGWWKGLIESNGQNSISFWTIRRLASQIDFCNDHVEDFVEVRISLAALGNPTAEAIRTWDFIITVSGHDGDSNDQNLGGTRWVNQATAEWQFGGGRDSEAGRERDANIVDLVTVPGSGKVPGRSQESMLDYTLDDAVRRFEGGKTACVLEATSSEDISPPVIRPFATDGFAHAVWAVLDNAPASFLTTIEDENDVDLAEFQWRPLGQTQWRVVPMVNIVEAYWVADIDPDSLRQAVASVELVDGSLGRPFEARLRARDQYGNEAQTSLVTFAVPDENLPFGLAVGAVPGSGVLFVDGTLVLVPQARGAPQYDSYDIKVTPLNAAVPEGIDFESTRSSMRYLDVARRIEITGHKGEQSEPVALLDDPVLLALHYPTYLDPETGDENKIGLFEYNDVTSRWIGIFGEANGEGNAVSADIRRPGAYALFSDRALDYDTGQGLSGVRAEPNPFSPNGDGLYDETRITFFLARDADWVTIEIFDLAGEPVRTIRWQQGLAATARNAFEIVWDGTDGRGRTVPYGIYVMRLEVRFKVAPYNERQNIGVAVIR